MDYTFSTKNIFQSDNMAIFFDSEDIKFPPIKRLETKRWIKAVAESYGKTIGDICYLFCTDEHILKVNQDYLQHDYFTDIITFDYCEGDTISGDLVISLETVASNSKKFNTDYLDELHRVIIHGVLHLCGLKDNSPEDEKKMREAENKALELLNREA